MAVALASLTGCTKDPEIGDFGTGTGSASLTQADETAEGADDTVGTEGGTGAKLDVGGSGEPPECGGEGGGMGLEEVAFSNIWVANSPQGTVSRIDTRTGDEIARYATGPTNATDPSRTTVNLVGDIAALNRGGGGSVIKIAAEQERCIDRNGDGAIQTSQGPSDVLPWNEDECVVWSKDLHAGARAAAWDSGSDPQAEDCAGEPSLWVSAMDPGMTVHVWRLAGDTGDEEGSISIPSWDGSAEWGGLYGGAVDRGRNFWAIGKDNAALFRVDFETMDVQRWEAPGVERLYGIAMDKDGNPYVTAEFDNRLLRFDVETESWEDLATISGILRGLAVDRNGDAWVATNQTCGLARYHHGSGAVDTINLPECNIPVGVSIDVDGFVWVVDQWAGAPPFGRAHKLDASSYAVELTVMGLDTPYTYSDMTGAGLDLVSFPPQG
ncbi:Vgb family protein [Paraliomyxa miuraensis]|uniref:Vgb family protein n=1 Tax=Paraliomyxa miuraensis TaxID=376150 RepID=UPI00225B7CFD|nr:hypothetical protein [Paraliomyxa miuraensis]MCX4244865.1 hypothetical protein [Paraliomyxa miuraensis]